jgi:hypothetical protein
VSTAPGGGIPLVSLGGKNNFRLFSRGGLPAGAHNLTLALDNADGNDCGPGVFSVLIANVTVGDADTTCVFALFVHVRGAHRP